MAKQKLIVCYKIRSSQLQSNNMKTTLCVIVFPKRVVIISLPSFRCTIFHLVRCSLVSKAEPETKECMMFPHHQWTLGHKASMTSLQPLKG